MSESYHTPVLAGEVAELLAPRPGDRIVDGTVGGGGHALLLGERQGQDGTLILIDRDPAALEAARQTLRPLPVRTHFVHNDFRRIADVLDSLGIPVVDAILLDLGVSSGQLNTADRGFSFRADAPLDMRMNPTAGESARELLDRLDRDEIARILREFGEERWAARIAEFIVRERDESPIETTMQLAEIVKAAIPRGAWPRDIHAATRTFQGLRIAVNDELGALQDGLDGGISRLAPGGRMAVISYHSLEDRIVKRTFRSYEGRCQCPPGLPECRCGARRIATVLTRKPIVPSEEEVARNPRARSARLRGVRRLTAL